MFLGSLAITCAVLCGAAEAEEASPQQLARIHTIGIISVLGDTLTLKDVGLMVFGNSETPESVTAWGLDDHISKEVATWLWQRYTIKPVTYDKSAFADIRPNIFDPLESELGKRVKALGPNGVDAYVIVYGTYAQDWIGGTNQFLKGIGIYHHLNWNGIYAVYSVFVIDASSGETIASGDALVPKGGGFDEEPWQASDESLWPGSEWFPADGWQDVRLIVQKLIDKSIYYGIAHTGLLAAPVRQTAASPAPPTQSATPASRAPGNAGTPAPSTNSKQ